jgi:valyl-tRNA synthetase
MSKMRGNVVNPLDWMEKYGTDALRFTLAIKAAPGTDIALSEEVVLGYRAFANKIWNAARFLFVNLEKYEANGETLESLAAPDVRAAAPHRAAGALPLVDRWIFSRLGRVVKTVNAALNEYRLHEAAHEIYHFFWGDFCDWYIEWTKPRLSSTDPDVARAAWRNIFAIFEAALRLLHPLMPFITEELWHQLPQAAGARSIALAQFPAPPADWVDDLTERNVTAIQEVIATARNLRSELKLDPKRPVDANFYCSDPDLLALIDQNSAAIRQLTPLSSLSLNTMRLDSSANSAKAAIRNTATYDLRIPYTETVDVKSELARIQKELQRLEKDIASKERQLGDGTFRGKAPAHIVQGMEAALAERKIEHQKLAERLRQLESGAA